MASMIPMAPTASRSVRDARSEFSWTGVLFLNVLVLKGSNGRIDCGVDIFTYNSRKTATDLLRAKDTCFRMA